MCATDKTLNFVQQGTYTLRKKNLKVTCLGLPMYHHILFHLLFNNNKESKKIAGLFTEVKI